jgi:hypothetical protein
VKLTWSASSQAIRAPETGGLGALLVSPFNVKWRFSVPAGGVEGSKLCLFSVIMPAKCISSISPRFHYRKLAFCFLPLATILESPAFCDYNKYQKAQETEEMVVSFLAEDFKFCVFVILLVELATFFILLC